MYQGKVNILLPKLNVEIITYRYQLGKSLKILFDEEVKERKPFLLCDHGYEAIMEE